MSSCDSFIASKMSYYQETYQSFIDAVKVGCPEVLKKPKIHLLLHLPDNMYDFVPTVAYNTEVHSFKILSLRIFISASLMQM